jgi:hypothetical protein
MDRKGFLKRVFGAAVVAAMPKVVVDQIESLPEPIPAPPLEKDVLEYAKEQIEPYKKNLKPVAPNGVLYIYDEETAVLLAACLDFNLELHQECIKFENDYFRGLESWSIRSYNIRWRKSIEEYFDDEKKLRCLIFKDNIKISGSLIITQLDSFAPLDKETSYGACFEGIGELIIEVNENNT